MTGLHRASPRPTEITLHSESRVLEIAFSDGRTFRLPYEFLRVNSPSAEVRGHGPGQEQTPLAAALAPVKEAVAHAIRPVFVTRPPFNTR